MVLTWECLTPVQWETGCLSCKSSHRKEPSVFFTAHCQENVCCYCTTSPKKQKTLMRELTKARQRLKEAKNADV